MFLSKPHSVEDIILDELKKGQVRSSDLILAAKKSGVAATKQGVYKILKKLNREEIVIFNKGTVILNTSWLSKLHSYLTVAQSNYSGKIILPGYFSNLEEGQKYFFNFKNPQLLDSYWGYILITLMSIAPAGKHLFAYNPHYWFLYARPESEKYFLRSVKANGRQFLLTVAGDTFLDRHAARIIDKRYFQYNILDRELFSKKNYYLNIIGDYIIEVYLDEANSRQVDDLFKTSNKMEQKVIDRLKLIISQAGKNRLIISKNNKRAEKFKQKMNKYFYLPK